MGMFGFSPKRLPYGMDEPYQTPGIGDGIPGNMRMDGGVNLQPGQGFQGVDTSLPADPYEGQRKENPGFFEKGGLGGKMAFGALGGALDGVAHYGGMDGGFVPAIQAAEKAQQEWQQRIALEKYKRENPEPTALQRDYDFYGQVRPDLQGTFLQSRADPVTMVADPSTGQMRAVRYSQASQPASGPQTKVVDGKTYYWVSGADGQQDWYDNAEGR